MKIHPEVHVSNLEPYFEDELNRKQKPPSLVMVENEEEYEVEEILDKRKHYRKNQLLSQMEKLPIIRSFVGARIQFKLPRYTKKFNLKNNN